MRSVFTMMKRLAVLILSVTLLIPNSLEIDIEPT
jgi:hypothetical protein